MGITGMNYSFGSKFGHIYPLSLRYFILMQIICISSLNFYCVVGFHIFPFNSILRKSAIDCFKCLQLVSIVECVIACFLMFIELIFVFYNLTNYLPKFQILMHNRCSQSFLLPTSSVPFSAFHQFIYSDHINQSPGSTNS